LADSPTISERNFADFRQHVAAMRLELDRQLERGINGEVTLTINIACGRIMNREIVTREVSARQTKQQGA